MRLRHNWFFRLLRSYIPILFTVASLLILIGAGVIVQQANRSAERVGIAQGEHMLQAVDSSLKRIEDAVIFDMVTDERIRQFFLQHQAVNPELINYRISQKLNEVVQTDPLLHSVYAYRKLDRVVMNESMFVPLEQSEDQYFIQSMLDHEEYGSWLPVRDYNSYSGQAYSTKVITMVKPFPISTGERGLLIVNVDLEELLDRMEQLSGTHLMRYALLDETGDIMAAYGEDEVKGIHVLSRYTGWELIADFNYGRTFISSSPFFYVWLVTGLLAVLLGVTWIYYVSRSNVQPLVSITDRIAKVITGRGSLDNQNPSDEFGMIEMAFDHFMEQHSIHELRYEQGLTYRRRLLFLDLLEGSMPVTEADWHSVNEYIQTVNGMYIALVMEIDKYTSFAEDFNRRDQNLFKFVISSVALEIAANRCMTGWGEWVTQDKFALLFALPNRQSGDQLLPYTDNLLEWLKVNIPFSVTIGKGSLVEQFEDIPNSYEECLHALQYKIALGSGRLIASEEAEAKRKESISFRYIHDVQQIVHDYRLAKPDWKLSLQQLRDKLLRDLPSDQDVSMLLRYMAYRFESEMTQLSEEYRLIWENKMRSRLERLSHQFQLMEGFEQLEQLLTSTEEELNRKRGLTSGYSLMMEVRRYIENRFHDSDLSLDHLSAKFGLTPKYLSRLFKDEFGERFLDYLAQVRIGQAKVLLVNGEEPVHRIAEYCGFGHQVSFIRTFKKITGMTPGEYRMAGKSNVVENGHKE